MPRSGSDRNHTELAQALSHPIRVRILELCTHSPPRALTASSLFPALTEEFDGLTLSQVSYHLVRLKDAELLPV
jgi:DNA-binding transcriptional ArsR family regulator